jgi:hypothetical protein
MQDRKQASASAIFAKCHSPQITILEVPSRLWVLLLVLADIVGL